MNIYSDISFPLSFVKNQKELERKRNQKFINEPRNRYVNFEQCRRITEFALQSFRGEIPLVMIKMRLDNRNNGICYYFLENSDSCNDHLLAARSITVFGDIIPRRVRSTIQNDDEKYGVIALADDHLLFMDGRIVNTLAVGNINSDNLKVHELVSGSSFVNLLEVPYTTHEGEEQAAIFGFRNKEFMKIAKRLKPTEVTAKIEEYKSENNMSDCSEKVHGVSEIYNTDKHVKNFKVTENNTQGLDI